MPGAVRPREAYAYCPLPAGTGRKPLPPGKPAAAAYAGSHKSGRLGSGAAVTRKVVGGTGCAGTRVPFRGRPMAPHSGTWVRLR